MSTDYFDRERITAGRNPGRRRRTMLFLLESWTDADAGDVVDFLASTEVFGGLDRTVLRDLLVHLEPVHPDAGATVISADEPQDSLYLVGYGRLEVGGPDGVVGERGPGQVVGAAALLSGGGGTPGEWARAVRDSLLLRLSAAAFESFAQRHPTALLGLCRELVRLVTVPAADVRAERTVSTVAVVAAGGAPVPADLLDRLVAALAVHGGTLALSAAALDAALGPGSAQTTPQDPHNGAVVSWLHRAEQQHRFVLYQADPSDSAWTRRCLRQADRVLLVGRSGANTRIGDAESAVPTAAGPRADLVLLHPAGAARAGGTSRWLAGRSVDAHHHVRGGNAADLRRLARHLAGGAVGLVLGGGGMRGFAHLGVMRALDEAGVEVDVVGGTSIGAIMAALYAAELTHEGRLHAASRAMVEQGSMVPATLPLVSFSSGRKVSRLLQEEPAFAGAVEDLLRPFFCVSASLREVREVVHTDGPIWRALRSSISLPGIYPPVRDGDDLLVDGGVINNLPVDVMARRVRTGPIIAVDVQPDLEHTPTDPFAESLSGWRVLGSRLHPARARLRVPRLADVLVRSLTLSSTRAQRERLAVRPVALHLRPPVGTSGLLDFQAGPALVDLAYRHTMDALDRTPFPS